MTLTHWFGTTAAQSQPGGGGDPPPAGSVYTEFDVLVGNVPNPYPTHARYGSRRAFVSAEGFGAAATLGAYQTTNSPSTYFVTNLNDSGGGSFRAAIEANGPRVIIPLVQGVLPYTGSYVISNPYVTLLGQFAPGSGLLIRSGLESQAQGEANGFSCVINETTDVVLRYLRIYRGYTDEFLARTGDAEGEGDAFTFRAGAARAIYDHCEGFYTADEGIGATAGDFVTIQHTMICDPLNGRHEKFVNDGTVHNFGCLVGYDARDWTMHHVAFTGSQQRQPWFKHEGGADVRNVLTHNCKQAGAFFTNDDGTNRPLVNYVNNYHSRGPYTEGFLTVRFDSENTKRHPQACMTGNEGYLWGADQWARVDFRDGASEANCRVNTEYDYPSVRTDSATAGRNMVRGYGGCSYVIDDDGTLRDIRLAPRTRIQGEITNGTGLGRPREEDEATDIPDLATITETSGDFQDRYDTIAAALGLGDWSTRNTVTAYGVTELEAVAASRVPHFPNLTPPS